MVELKLNKNFGKKKMGLSRFPKFPRPNKKALAIIACIALIMTLSTVGITTQGLGVFATQGGSTSYKKALPVNGVDGLDGLDGADGLSAYDIAVKNGFGGSEKEWISQTTTKISEATAKTDELQKQIDDNKKLIDDAIKNGNADLAKELEAKNKDLQNQLDKSLAELQALIDALGERADGLENSITNIENTNIDIKNQITNNKTLIEQAIKNGNADLAKELEAKNAALQAQLDKNLAELKALLDKLNSRTDGLENSITNINTTNVDIQRQITINKKLLEDSIKNGNTDLQKELEARNAALQAQLDKNLAELQALLDKLGTRTDSLEDSVAVINSKNAEIKQEMDDNKALIDKAIADGNADLQKELEEKNNSLQAKFNANLSELQAENELLKGQVSALQGRIKSMEDENRTIIIDPTTKHWIVGGVDTGVSSQGAGMEDGWAIGTIRNSAPSGITSSNWRQVKDTKTTTTPTTRCIGTLYRVRDIGDGGDVKYIYMCRACGVSKEFGLGSGSQEGTTCGRMIGNDEICHVYSVDSLSAAQVDKLASRTLDPLNLPISAAGKYIYVGRPD